MFIRRIIYLCTAIALCSIGTAESDSSFEKLLEKPMESIVDRSFEIPGGDPHDYASLAIYWWPNPITKLPYIRKDGRVNPEVNQYDAPRFQRMASLILSLANAFEKTGDSRFAENAEQRIRLWFLNPKTRMNPAMRYAQFIPGFRKASYHGLIEGDVLCTKFLDGVYILKAYDKLSPETLQGLEAWFSAFTQWFLTSDLGKEEGSQKNNHGIWYDYQIARYAEFAGDKEILLDTLRHVGERRIAVQIESDGRMPAEMARTKSFSYTCYALQPLLMLAEMGKNYGIDITDYQSPSGTSIAQALKFALIHSKDPDKWPGQQIVPLNRKVIINLTEQYLKLRQNEELQHLLTEAGQ